jgi:hypothetical protein
MPTMFPDGRVMVLNQFNQWVEIPVISAVPQPQPQQLFQARASSQPPVSQASSISEEIAEEVLAQPATKARASIIEEEEVEEDDLSSQPMTFLSSQDRHEPADSVCSSGSSWVDSEPVDLSQDFAPLTKQEVAPTTSSTIEVQKYAVARRVQVRAGPTATSENLFVLSPPQRVQVAKTQTTQTKTGFLITKAYVLADQGQGWVSINRQHKKTGETFVFKGKASDGMKRLIMFEKVWERHQATVVEIVNTTEGTFTVRVKCPRWQQVEALRKDLKNLRICGKTLALVNKRTPELVNLERVFGNNRPCAHVFNIDVDARNGHAEFLEDFDWSNQFKGSTKDFQHQVRGDLRALKFGGVRRVTWAAGRTSAGRFSMRDYCTVEFSKDSQLRNFLKNFEKYEFFQGAQVKVDPIYANLTSVAAESLKA